MKVALLGSGNVSWHLQKAISGCSQHQIAGIISRKETSQVFTSAVPVVQEAGDILKFNPDLIILCVPDDLISAISSGLSEQLPADIPLAHTSGSKALKAIDSYFHQRGVFYPLQTLSIHHPVDFQKIPLLLEADDPIFFSKLHDLASCISLQVKEVSSRFRAEVHLAAVILNNYTNHLIFQAQQYLNPYDLDLDLFKPLLQETIRKAFSSNPYDAQTGPARRRDLETIRLHLKKLKDSPTMLEIYRVFAESIEKTYH